jgi:hypothetical protein
MKRWGIIACMLLFFVPLFVFAEAVGDWNAAYGDWKIVGDRLVQQSTTAGMAQATLKIPQTGVIQYEFDAKPIAGYLDQYAGFGVHIGIDKSAAGKSWGNGDSFLLWLTYDPKAYGGLGVYAQAYQSFNHSRMEIIHKGNAYAIPAQYLEQVDINRLDRYVLPVKIVVDYDTGLVKVYDPTRENYYYKFSLGGPLSQGSYVSLRTNSMAASFGNFKVTRLK